MKQSKKVPFKESPGGNIENSPERATLLSDAKSSIDK